MTVPECLEILLLSGQDEPFWSLKIKYVIFDEVHSLGSEEGAVWERLILLIDCPCTKMVTLILTPSFGIVSNCWQL